MFWWICPNRIGTSFQNERMGKSNGRTWESDWNVRNRLFSGNKYSFTRLRASRFTNQSCIRCPHKTPWGMLSLKLHQGCKGYFRPKPFYFWNQCRKESDPTQKKFWVTSFSINFESKHYSNWWFLGLEYPLLRQITHTVWFARPEPDNSWLNYFFQRKQELEDGLSDNSAKWGTLAALLGVFANYAS